MVNFPLTGDGHLPYASIPFDGFSFFFMVPDGGRICSLSYFFSVCNRCSCLVWDSEIRLRMPCIAIGHMCGTREGKAIEQLSKTCRSQ